MIDVAFVVLRVILGLIFVVHGSQKLFGLFGGPGIRGTAAFFEQAGIKPGRPMALLAGLAEVFGGLLTAVGFLTPLARLTLVATTAVAAVKVHLRGGFFNTNGGYEFDLALAGMAAALVIAGPGDYSLDGVLGLFW